MIEARAGRDGVWRRRFPIADAHAGFDGHFPGDPILPGIVQIALLLEALRDRLGPDVYLAAIPSLRWRSVVRPGTELDLTAWGPSEDGRVGFEMRAGDTLVSNGTAEVRRAGP
jgi:3-hydroxymyristoyl/3-hydroxydecanoyl-(acyl carrier protein) dehydratase